MIKLNESKLNNVPINDNHQLWCELLGTWITPKQYKEIEVKWNHIFKDSIKINDYSKVEKKYGIYLDWIRESIGASKSKKTNESTQVSDVNTGRPSDTSITVKKKKDEMNESKKWAVDIYEDDEFDRTKYFSDKHAADKWVDQYNYSSKVGDSASDPYLVNESVDISKLIKSGDKDKLTKYLASLGDGEVITDPKDKNTIYHKASNGVKSGWGEHRNGKRINITLYKDDQLAKFLLNESADMNESASFDEVLEQKFNDQDLNCDRDNPGVYEFQNAKQAKIGLTIAKKNGYSKSWLEGRKLHLNESADMTQVSTLEGQGCDREAVAVPCASEEPVTEPMPKKDDSQKFTDKKYMTILNILKANGYEGTRFFGSEGYLIPDKYPNTKVRLVCRTISEGFKVNVIGGLYDMATSKECMKQLRECNQLADKLNQILIDDTNINEMIDASILTSDEENLAD